VNDLTNMLISPRAPVWLSNYVTRVRENRFYLDLNRNGMDDPNGWITNVNSGQIVLNGDGSPSTNFQVGDPEWIGVLDHPDQPHGPNNRFIARYAFVAVPIGNALDLNAIYNDAMRPDSTMRSGNDGFLRNQGVGSWEINLAAFLADLNTNEWDSSSLGGVYDYQTWNGALYNGGSAAFSDALSLLKYRYGGVNGTYNNLAPVGGNNPLGLFTSANVFPPFQNDIDAYSGGPPQTTPANINVNGQDVTRPWSGADNTNHFFDMQELFSTNETYTAFANSLTNAGGTPFPPNSTSTYNRYTYYRLLSQMGVDSAPEQNKMNLNYDNLDLGFNGALNPNGTANVTNFVPWTALGFFTNAADRMLRAYSQNWLARDPSNYLATYYITTNIGTVPVPTNIPVSFGITDIPVLVSNQFVYSSAIQRVLQLAANMYDATTNNTVALGNNYPSVFRPTFNAVLENGYTNVYVNGYQQVVSVIGTNDVQLNLPVNVTSLSLGASVAKYANGVNVYGVPWIIGAKKDFPNFNEFSMEETVGVTRRLQVTRTATNAPNSVDFTQFHTNQMYTMSVSNSLGVECWNSYSNNYVPASGSLSIVAQDTLSMELTNDDTPILTVMQPTPAFLPTFAKTVTITTVGNPPYWPGSGPTPWYAGKPNVNSFDIPWVTNYAMSLSYSYAPTTNWWQYWFGSHQFLPIPNTPVFETNINNNFYFPHFGLLTTNRLQVFILDGNHVIDYVQVAGPDTSLDLNTNLFTDNSIGNGSLGVWNTNLSISGVPDGVLNQIQVSKGGPPPEYPPGSANRFDGTWHSDNNTATPPQQQAFFAAFFMPGNKANAPAWDKYQSATATNLGFSVEAPYTPTRYVVLYTTWQANDPLVHYVAGDLNYTAETGTPHPGINEINYGTTITNLPNLGVLNDHYAPWGGNPIHPPNSNTPDDPGVINQYNLAVKDPLISFSDNWDFPTNKMPTVGWLGRVHRGTPWQTVDLKSALPGISTWTNWTGDLNAFDANNSSPGEDRQLFDLFSTAVNDNATRGQLSVNVGATNGPSLAAWSALFSGIVVPTNTIGGYTVIQPAGAYNAALPLANQPPLVQLVANINATRLGYTNVYGLPAFEHVGDILATPQLSIFTNAIGQQSPFLDTNTIYSDEMYEWLPQQVMSLLRVSGTPQSPMRYVIYCYGQTLKPAQNGIVTGGSLFGICTNYQVVAEAATRAVVQFNSTRTDNIFQTNYPPSLNLIWTNVPSVPSTNAVIEGFNVLPPN
jgi:hypothetical protein